MKIIEGEFECPASQVFSYISDEPVAAASFGQVIVSSRASPLHLLSYKLFEVADVFLFSLFLGIISIKFNY